MKAIDDIDYTGAPMVLGTAGHIDHGKTSLVRALTGMETDTLKDEARRGMTIDLGFAHMEDCAPSGKAIRLAIVDVPGHERFIKNMLAGVSSIDAVLFVVAADDGVMPQTLEHFDIVNMLGVQRGVFAITKCDIASKERVQKVVLDVRSLKAGTALEAAEVLPVSATSGEGMDALRSSLFALASSRSVRKRSHFFRLPIDRAFSIKGHGAVVTGVVVGGGAGRGDDLFIFPTGEKAKARAIQCLHREEATALAGTRAALNLSGVSHVDLKRGHIVAEPALRSFALHANRSNFIIRCSFDLLAGHGSGTRAIKNGAPYKVHHLTSDATARIFLDKGPEGTAASTGRCGRLVLTEPLLMLRGDRFIVRDPSINRTIGAGTVLLPFIAGQGLVKHSGILPGDGIDCALEKTLSVRLCIDIEELSVVLNASRSELSALIDKDPRFAMLSGKVALKARIDIMEARAREILNDYHAQNQNEAGMREEALVSALCRAEKRMDKNEGASFTKAVLEGMVTKRALRRDASIISLASHAPALSGPDASIGRAILGLMPHGGAILACDVGRISALPYKKADVDRVLAYLLRTKAIVRVAQGVFVSGEQVNDAVLRLKAHLRTNKTIRASEFRDILGCGRKLAIELLEYFDAQRITLRKGDERVLRSSDGF